MVVFFTPTLPFLPFLTPVVVVFDCLTRPFCLVVVVVFLPTTAPFLPLAATTVVVRVWRKDAKAVPPKLDAQGRSRIYLKEGLDTARGGDLGPIPMYAAAMDIEGKDCGK